MAVRERRSVTSEVASHAAETFMADRAGMSPLEARALAVAARRYLTSLSEADQVDRYCDLWESCEFSTMFEKAKGGKVGKIAQALASHLKRNRVNVTKAHLEGKLEIKSLYKTRGKIVHDAVESPEKFEEKMGMLEAVASELLRYRFGLPYYRESAISDKLPSTFASETIPKNVSQPTA